MDLETWAETDDLEHGNMCPVCDKEQLHDCMGKLSCKSCGWERPESISMEGSWDMERNKHISNIIVDRREVRKMYHRICKGNFKRGAKICAECPFKSYIMRVVGIEVQG